MPIQNQYNLDGTLSALDAYEPRRSLPVADDLQLSIIVGNFSESFAVEAIESRIIVSLRVVPGPGERPALEIVAKHKPIVIEALTVTLPGVSTSAFIGRQQATMIDGAVAEAGWTQMGGRDALAVVHSGKADIIAAQIDPVVVWVKDNQWTQPEDIRWFIPPGWRFTSTHGLNEDMIVSAIVRELEDLPVRR